jgi:hypothetical protein
MTGRAIKFAAVPHHSEAQGRQAGFSPGIEPRRDRIAWPYAVFPLPGRLVFALVQRRHGRR